MGERVLDIIMTHYDEPYSLARPGLDMLRNQQGVDYSKILVTIIHDGTNKFVELEKDPLPFETRQIVIPHGGVSKARNHGIDIADAEWVTFFDCDDSLSSICSLEMLLRGLDTKDYDFLWHSFYIVQSFQKPEKPIIFDDFNLMFMLAKYFRLSFLREHDVRFYEDLSYAEDGAFDRLAYAECDISRIGKIDTQFPIYAWIRRVDSATLNPIFSFRNQLHAFHSNKYTAEAYKERNKDSADLLIARAITDAYVAITREMFIGHPDKESFEQEVADFIVKHKEDLKNVNLNGWNFVLERSERLAAQQKLLNPDRPLFKDWYADLKQRGEIKNGE